MGQLQKVSWRSAGYAALGTALAAASVIAVINSDGVHPTSLTSNAATRWLVDRVNGRVVLVDGLAGEVLAKITTDSDLADEVAVQGAGGAFLVGTSQGAVRTISTAKLQLGTAQPIALLTEPDTAFGVGASGLTVVNPDADKAKVVAVDDVSRDIDVPKADDVMVAGDGSMWMLSPDVATHVNVDQSSSTVPVRGKDQQKTTVGAKAVTYDGVHTVRWLDGADIDVDSVLPNPSEAILQEPGDAAPCVWLGVDDTLACVGATGVDQTVTIPRMHIGPTDRLAVAGSTAVIVTNRNDVTRIDLASHRVLDDDKPTISANATLGITAAADMIWLDDLNGELAWVVQPLGINVVHKDADAPLLDAQGQVQAQDDFVEAAPTPGGPGGSDGEEIDHPEDTNGVQDPPVAVDDSVTARAGNVITIPVTANDWDPDGDAIAVLKGDTKSATHGTTDVLSGTSIAYRPDPGYSGTDSFDYTITDENGGEASATVSVELFSPDSPNRPPIARADSVKTRIGRPVTIDVLANDIDPERDMLTVSSFQGAGLATITTAEGPTGLPALLYTPPAGQPGTYHFTYQAADPQGGLSQKTEVTVDVSATDSDNSPPTAKNDSIRLAVGVVGPLDVKANDYDDDGDSLTISYDENVAGVDVKVVSQRLNITLLPGSAPRTVIHYQLTDNITATPAIGKVLVLRIDDTNRPPVANADTERVVIGNTVKIPVTANDVDPDLDPIRLLSVTQASDGVSTATVENNSVRFTPNLPDITEPTPVTFAYTITDGHGHEATGNVTVTVLVEALPRAPFAADDFGDTVTNKPVTIDVLANDSDPSGGKPSLIADPVCGTGGSAVRTSDDRVTFTPPTGATGTYKCKYTVANSQGLRAEASIIVTVTAAPAANTPPTMNPARINQTVILGQQLTLSANDVASDADNDSLVFTSASVGSPAHGSVTSTPKSSTLVYTAPLVGSPDRTPTSDTLNVVISDGHDGNITGQISIKINDTTPLPTPGPLTHEIQRAWIVGSPLPIDVVAELRDQNPNTTLTLNSVALQSGPGTATLAGGLAVIEPTGPGTIIATYIVGNGSATTTDKIVVTVAAPPPANPPVANNDAMVIDSGGSNSIDLTANDTGISDPGDVPTVALVNRPPSSFGTVTLVNSTLTFSAAPGASGVANIRYTLSDGSGTSSTATVSLNVLPCSESLPSARAASEFTPYMKAINIDLRQYVTSGHIRPGSVSGAGLTDVTGTYVPPAGMNGIETVTYVVENGCQQTFPGQLTIDVNHAPSAATVNKPVARGETLTLSVTDLAHDDEQLTILPLPASAPNWVSLSADSTSIIATPPNGAPSGNYSFTATVRDPGGLTADASITLVISNTAPTAIADAYEPSDAPFEFNPTLNDRDPEGDALTITSVTWVSPPGLPVPTWAGNDVTVSPPHGESTLSYTIRDTGGLTSTSTITITYNREPTIQPTSGSMNGGTTAHIPLDIFEPDGDTVQVVCQSSDSQVSAQAMKDPGSLDPTHPLWAVDVVAPVGFTAYPVTIHCVVRDQPYGERASADITVTA